MFAFVSQPDSFYGCDAYDPQTLVCTAYEVVSAPAFFPVLSTAEANSIAGAMIQLFIMAWCFRFLGSVIDDYEYQRKD